MAKAKVVPAKVPTAPSPGEKWEFKSGKQSGPWGSSNSYPLVTVLEVQGGWVRYAIGKTHPDNRKDIASFVYMYARAESGGALR